MFINKDGKKIESGRIVGGIAWPGEKPGFIVIVGEELYPEIGGKVYNCHLLNEHEDPDVNRLIEKCIEFIKFYKVICFFGRNDKHIIDYIYHWNMTVRKSGQPRFDIDYATNSKEGLIGYHIKILLERLNINRKSLHLSEHSKLPGYLQEISSDKICSATDAQYPAVAALGYAVTELTLYPPEPEYEEKVNRRRDVGVTGY